MIGVDLVEIKRFENFLKKFGKKAFAKYLDEDEIELASNAKSAAGFFAAKEAISKALGLGISQKCGFFDIKIYKLPNGAPSFTLSSHLVKSYKIKSVSLSISHDGGFAIAVAAIEGEMPNEQKLSHR
ncbi:MAG: holo-ACP synthase [Campylobacteraceae bacterium]|jgi:holo-[acyl-carrier protein] synthase|nr:holo-ACP synthase [Campylobacteraceae bacterium]